jgi:hypothetical protein
LPEEKVGQLALGQRRDSMAINGGGTAGGIREGHLIKYNTLAPPSLDIVAPFELLKLKQT